MAKSQTMGASEGPATDRNNMPVVDPTENVLQLVEAANQRQDDLRNMESRYTEQIATIRDVQQRATAALREMYQEKLRIAEAARIDAIRAVDVGAVQRAAEVQAIQATTLQTQVATTAEALRTQVAAAAAATATNLAAALAPIQKDVSELRQVQFQQQGERTTLTETRTNEVQTRGMNAQTVGMLVGLGGLAVLLIDKFLVR